MVEVGAFTRSSKLPAMNSLLAMLGTALVGVAVAGTGVAQDSVPVERSDARPNVLLIVSDDQGYADAGFQGSREIPTPNLDRLAASGTICTAGYVTFPVCSPSRAGFLSGRHGARFGYETNPDLRIEYPDQAGFPLTERTLADAMKRAGYVTGLVGKWHLGLEPRFHPNARGFDDFFGFLGGGHRYMDWKPGKDYESVLLHDATEVPGIEKRYLTDVFSDEALRFVEQNRARPFFLYLAYNAPHTPVQATPEYLARVPALTGRRQVYAAMLVALDDGVGRLLAKLEELGLEQDTLVLFITDNGGPLEPNASDNSPLRGKKGEVWEGGIRVPYVVSWPGHVPAGARYDRPVSTLDFLPTALALAGVDNASMPATEGVNLLPFLQGTETSAPHPKLFWRHHNGSWAVREGDWKLVQDPDGERYLFDLARDIGERHDRIEAEPETAARLLASWRAWNASNASCNPWTSRERAGWPPTRHGRSVEADEDER